MHKTFYHDFVLGVITGAIGVSFLFLLIPTF